MNTFVPKHMKVLYYLLALIVIRLLRLVINILMPILTIWLTNPLIILQEKIHNTPRSLYGLRYDMIFQRLLAGLLVAYLYVEFLELLPISISILWSGLCYCILSIILLRLWDKSKPWNYEASVVLSQIIGDALGFIFIILPFSQRN